MADAIIDDIITPGFRKAHMHAFCYSIRDMNYKQMRLMESSLHVSLYALHERSLFKKIRRLIN